MLSSLSRPFDSLKKMSKDGQVAPDLKLGSQVRRGSHADSPWMAFRVLLRDSEHVLTSIASKRAAIHAKV